MSRSLALFLAVLTVAGLAAPQAHAKDFRAKYEDVTLPLITDYMVRSKGLKLDTQNKMMDYLKLTECDIYKAVKNSQFKQQAIQSAIQRKIDQPIPGDGNLYVKIPTVFYITNYDFDTQSFNLAPKSRMKRANILDLISKNISICDESQSEKMSLPGIYNIRLNYPISFYRIPLQKNLAETVFNKLDFLGGSEFKVIYGLLYIQIEPVPPLLDTASSTATALAHGQLDVIDLFLDHDRKILLRQLDFGENF